MPALFRCLPAIALLLALPASAQANTVLTADAQDAPPKYIIENNAASGLCADLFRAIETTLGDVGIALNPGHLPPKRIVANLIQGSTQLHCGHAYNKERAAELVYSAEPLYQVHNIVISRADNPTTISSAEDLARSGQPVGTVFGTDTMKFLQELEGVTPVGGITSVEQALSMLDNGRIAYFVYHDLGLLYDLKKTGRASQYKVHPAKLRSYEHWMTYSQKLAPELRTRIDDSLKTLHQQGRIQEIMAKYR